MGYTMSVASKHYYREVYLKSDQWQKVRLEAIVREKGYCQICSEFSISNDAHHIWYPKDIYDTTAHQLVVLCRPCHTLIHAFMDCSVKSRDEGWNNWKKFSFAVKLYRSQQAKWFVAERDAQIRRAESRGVDHVIAGPKELRAELERLKTECGELKIELARYCPDYTKEYTPNYII